MKGTLPERVRTKKEKEGDFTRLMDRQTKQYQEASGAEFLMDSALARAGILDQEKLQKLWKTYYHDQDGSGRDERWHVLSIMNLEKWYRTF